MVTLLRNGKNSEFKTQVCLTLKPEVSAALGSQDWEPQTWNSAVPPKTQTLQVFMVSSCPREMVSIQPVSHSPDRKTGTSKRSYHQRPPREPSGVSWGRCAMAWIWEAAVQLGSVWVVVRSLESGAHLCAHLGVLTLHALCKGLAICLTLPICKEDGDLTSPVFKMTLPRNSLPNSHS